MNVCLGVRKGTWPGGVLIHNMRSRVLLWGVERRRLHEVNEGRAAL